jgi:hypothetical protein
MEYSLNVETSESLVAAACLVLAFKMKGIEVILPLILRRSAVPFSLARVVAVSLVRTGTVFVGTVNLYLSRTGTVI